MNLKYAKIGKKTQPNNKPGRIVDPSKWKTGPNILDRERYYAWLKHKAQCNFRGELHELTWEDWQELWPEELFLKRGRSQNSLVLSRINVHDSWRIDNVSVTTKGEHLKRNGEFRRRD